MSIEATLPSVIVLAGPTCSGKTSLQDFLCDHGTFKEKISRIQTCTTRKQREGEPDDAYLFLTREDFLCMEREGQLAEWAEYGGNMYGTPWSEINRCKEENKIGICVMDINGVKAMLGLCQEKKIDLSVFILLVRQSERLKRAINRDGDGKIVEKRKEADGQLLDDPIIYENKYIIPMRGDYKTTEEFAAIVMAHVSRE